MFFWLTGIDNEKTELFSASTDKGTQFLTNMFKNIQTLKGSIMRSPCLIIRNRMARGKPQTKLSYIAKLNSEEAS